MSRYTVFACSWCLLLVLLSGSFGFLVGRSEERGRAVKAGVAGWSQDPRFGTPVFEYKK